METKEPFERRLTLRDTEICYFEWPGPSDSLVLLLHATGFHARCWDKTVAALPDGNRVLALDLRGHGRSGKNGPFGWFDLGDDVVAFIDALGLNNIVLAGHSVGGHCALYASSQRIEHIKALVLIDPVILRPEQYGSPESNKFNFESEEHPVARRRNHWLSVEEMFNYFKGRSPFNLWRPDILQDYCKYGLIRDENGYSLACPPAIEAAIYQGTRESQLDHLLTLISCPTIVIRAKQGEPSALDFTNSPTNPNLSNLLPNARDVFRGELTHFVPMQRPELVANEILSALKS